MVGMAKMGAPISLDGVTVHPDCWCVFLCYLHCKTENPQHGKIYLLIPTHQGCPGHSPECCKMVVWVCVVCITDLAGKRYLNVCRYSEQVYLSGCGLNYGFQIIFIACVVISWFPHFYWPETLQLSRTSQTLFHKHRRRLFILSTGAQQLIAS